MLLDAIESQLVLVDYQTRLMPVIFESATVLANAVRLGKLARLMEVPVFGTEQNPSKLGENASEVRALRTDPGQNAFQRGGRRLGRMAAPP